MQPVKGNQLFVFEDDEDIIEDPIPQEIQQVVKHQKNEQNQASSLTKKDADLNNYHEQIVSPNFNSLPSHLKGQQNSTTSQRPQQQKQSKAPNFVFSEQNAYSFRKDELEPKSKNSPNQIENQLEIISDFNSQISKNQGLIQGNDQVTSGVSRNRNQKSRRSRNRSKFQDINDESSVKSSKLGHYKEAEKLVPNILNQQTQKPNQQDYHKTEDHLRHDKNNHEEIIQSIRGISPNLKKDKGLPPLNSHKPGQIFINTSGILQNETSMVVLKPKQDFNKLSMTNMSSLTQMLHNENDKIKTLSDKIVPRGKTFKCHLQREKVCGLSFWHPIFSFFYKNEKLILTAKKQFGRINSLYNISSQQKNFDRANENYSGFLAGNFVGSIFNLYQKVDDVQQLVCTIVYDIQCSCSSSTRKIEIYLKNETCSTQSLFRHNGQRDCNLKQLYYLGQNAKQKKIIKIINKKPELNEQNGCYSLNFKGKCKMASVKNAVFISQDEPNRYVLLFCKTDQHNFYAQISFPLSPFVAMGIILSSFDFKLFCQ